MNPYINKVEHGATPWIHMHTNICIHTQPKTLSCYEASSSNIMHNIIILFHKTQYRKSGSPEAYVSVTKCIFNIWKRYTSQHLD